MFDSSCKLNVLKPTFAFKKEPSPTSLPAPGPGRYGPAVEPAHFTCFPPGGAALQAVPSPGEISPSNSKEDGNKNTSFEFMFCDLGNTMLSEKSQTQRPHATRFSLHKIYAEVINILDKKRQEACNACLFRMQAAWEAAAPCHHIAAAERLLPARCSSAASLLSC